MMRRCDICKLDIQDEYSFQGHIAGKKHKKNAQQFQERQSHFDKSIFVTNFPPNVYERELFQFFSQFGPMVNFSLRGKHLIIDFQNKDSAEYLMRNSVYFANSKLIIKPRIAAQNNTTKPPIKKESKKQMPETINGTVDLVFDNIKSIFEVESTFDEQLTAFLNKVAISESEIKSRYELTCRKLEEIFQRQVYATCKVCRFGSTVTGLGFKNCDLDMYLDIGLTDNQRFAGPNPITPAAVFNEVKRIFFRSKDFQNVVPIPKAKTPIIKFTYSPTNVACDISFKNSLAVHNSRLLRFYLSLDPRLQPAMMILKYWMSSYELSRNDRMSKYSLTLLFIFYLQQPSVKLVPPIIELKKRCRPQIVEGWQVNFDDTLSNYQQNNSETKNKKVPEILHGFFEFYSKYDFKSNVICPIDGLSHKRTIFTNINQLPESMYFYKEYLETTENPNIFPITKSICLQDPNELNHNVAGNVPAGYLEVFQKYCTALAEILTSEAENNNKSLLLSLFSLNIEVTTASKIVGTFVIFAQNYLKVGLPNDFDSQKDVKDKNLLIRKNWYDLVFKLIKKILEKVLRFEVELVEPEPSEVRELKQQKVDSNSDVHSNDQSKIILICKGDFCTWRNRSKLKSNLLDPSTSLLEKEIQTTDNMFDDAKNKPEKMKVEFKCEIIKRKEPVQIVVNLKCTEKKKKSFVELAKFLANKIPTIVTKTLGHMQQFQKNSLA